MSRHLNWYLTELESSLRGRIPGTQLAETINEVEAHILDGAEQLAPMCRHGEDPEQLAVERFGSPSQIAKEITGQAGTPLYWEAATAPMVWCFALALWLTVVSDRLALVLGLLIGLVGFVRACRVGKRLVPGALALSVAAAAFIAIPFLAATRSKPSDAFSTRALYVTHRDRDEPAAVERRIAIIRSGLQVFGEESPPTIHTGFESGGGYLAPAMVLMPAAGRSGTPLSWRQAKAAWRRDGWSLLGSLQTEERVMETPSLEYEIVPLGFGDAIRNWAGLVAVLAFVYWAFMVLVNAACRAALRQGSIRWVSRVI